MENKLGRIARSLLLIVASFHPFDTVLLGHFYHLRGLQSSECDFFKGGWIYDDGTYPLYNASSCPFIDKAFDCQGNGRPDQLYFKYRWKPKGCELPKFDGVNFLRKFDGKRIMFVGDSLSLNQWLSLTCMLHQAAPASNFTIQKTGSLSAFYFLDHNVSLFQSRNPFLVDLVEQNRSRVLKLDSIRNGDAWKGFDILVFNTWHWWLHRGTLQPWDYIEEGDNINKDMDRLVAFGKGLRTWSKWVDSNVNTSLTQVFFQGISPTHYKSDDWNASRIKTCFGETTPLNASKDCGGSKAMAAEAVVKGVLANMTAPVFLLDVTMLSQLRKDGHPSTFYGIDGQKKNDCSHWCLPGVPDTWNQLFYAIIIKM